MFALLLSLSALAAGPANASKLDVNAERVFVPLHYDSNDRVVVVLDGYLENGCYKLAKTLVRIDLVTKSIFLQPTAYKYEGECEKVKQVPFSESVDLGYLEAGPEGVTYALQVNGDERVRIEKTLPIKAAGESILGPDDYFYAPVSAAAVNYDVTTKKFVVTLKGERPRSCVKIDAANFKVFDAGDVIEILPIMDVLDTNDCKDKGLPFTVNVSPEQLPVLKPFQRYLFHVRSLNGNAVNVVYTAFGE